MKLQDQVITLEQAKRLGELGVNAESIFYHIEQPTAKYHSIEFGRIRDLYINDEQWVIHYEYAALMADEIRKCLPNNNIVVFQWEEFGEKGATCCWFENEGKSHIISEAAQIKIGRTYAIALGDMLIHLLENKIITPEQCNASLAL